MPQVLMGLSCGMVWRQALASVSLMGLQGDLEPPGALSGPLGFEMYCPTGMNGPGCQHWKGPRSVGLAIPFPSVRQTPPGTGWAQTEASPVDP